MWLERPNLLRDYQIIIGAIVALAAAVLGGWLLHNQTMQSARQEEARRANRFRASKALLPLALAEIAAYAKANVRSLQ